MLVIVIVIFGLVIIEKVSSPKCDEKGHNFAHHTYISCYECKFCHSCLRFQTQINLLKSGVKDVDYSRRDVFNTIFTIENPTHCTRDIEIKGTLYVLGIRYPNKN